MPSALDVSHWPAVVHLASKANCQTHSKSRRGSVLHRILATLPLAHELPVGLSPVTEDETPLVAVIGVGYVGLHLVTGFSKHYNVIAFDLSQKRLESVAGELLPNARLCLTSDPSRLASATHFLVSVPTLLVPGTSVVDTSYLQSAIDTIAVHARVGATVVIESSVAVGMTRSLLAKIALKHQLKAGMSPEVSLSELSMKNIANSEPFSALTPVASLHPSSPSPKSFLGSMTSPLALCAPSKSSILRFSTN